MLSLRWCLFFGCAIILFSHILLFMDRGSLMEGRQESLGSSHTTVAVSVARASHPGVSERTPGQRPGASTQLPALDASRPKVLSVRESGCCRVDGQRGSVTRPFLSVPPRTRTCCFYSIRLSSFS